jgi:hypothetical protein
LVVIDVVGNLVVIDLKNNWFSLMSIDVMVVFGEVSKVVPYGIALSMSLMGRHFEEVYKKHIGVVMKHGVV